MTNMEYVEATLQEIIEVYQHIAICNDDNVDDFKRVIQQRTKTIARLYANEVKSLEETKVNFKDCPAVDEVQNTTNQISAMYDKALKINTIVNT